MCFLSLSSTWKELRPDGVTGVLFPEGSAEPARLGLRLSTERPSGRRVHALLPPVILHGSHFCVIISVFYFQILYSGNFLFFV